MSMKCQVLLWLSCCVQLSAQQPFSIEIGNLRDGFHHQYILHEKTGVLDSCDVFHLCYKDSINLNNTGLLRLVYDRALHQTEGRQLPPSHFVIIQDETTDGQSETGTLYWAGTLKEAESKENVALSKWMQKRYGRLNSAGSQPLVPAKWFTGTVQVLDNPFTYGGQAVSHHGFTYQIKDGVVCPSPQGRLCVSHFTYHGADRIAATVSQMRENDRMEIRLDGTFNSKEEALKSRRGLFLFASNVNSLMDKELLSDEIECTLPIMLYLDSWGKAHLYSLSERLSTQDSLLLALLSFAVSSQPTGIFQPYWCEKGAFPAIYLEAKLKHRKWSFTDYRFK